MPHIIIKRPTGHRQWAPNEATKPNCASQYTGALTRVGEIRHGIQGQCQNLQCDSDQFVMRTPHKKMNYLAFAKEKQLGLDNSLLDKDFHGPSSKDLIKNEKMACKVYDAFLSHITNYIKNAARHGHEIIELDIAQMLESFQRYRTPGTFDPHEQTRNLAVWLQQMIQNSRGKSVHHILGKTIVEGLRNSGYTRAKLETRHTQKTIKTPPKVPSRPNSLVNAVFKKQHAHTSTTQTISIPRDVITVSTSPSKQSHLDNLNPKTQAAIRHKIPSWIGSIFE